MGEVSAEPFVSRLDYPMFVATTRVGDTRSGCLVGFATQTSIDPARLLTCLSRRNATTRVAADAEFLVVHQLREDQVELARLFGEATGDELDKFSRCRWQEGPHRLPVLAGCPAWFAGRIIDRLDLGDHIGMLLEPLAVHGEPPSPLLMFHHVRDLQPGHSA